jgi:predicted secreted hydrolase
VSAPIRATRNRTGLGRPARPRPPAFRWIALLSTVALFLAACAADLDGTGGLPPAPQPTPPAYPPVSLPRDEAPHQDLTEWWYYTGHLEAADGRRWGFELVVFQVLRGPFPPFYLSHFAVTDHQRRSFTHDERRTQGPQPQPAEGFALDVGGWSMRGLNGRDHLTAAMSDYAIDLGLSTDRPPVLHGGGLVTFGPAGDSYYYSRTRMEIAGVIHDHGEQVPVRGLAWCDRQWGNFLVLGGGWDWFSIQLDDGSDVMLNLIRDDQGVVRLAYGTYVEPSGAYRHLEAGQFEVRPTGRWTSPRTGATYPMGWQAHVRDPDIQLTLRPVLEDQELDTARSTGIVYWEGDVDVVGTRDGRPIRGQAYVEMTGYAAR